MIANFPRIRENRNRMSGPGMATITVFSKPKNYEDLARWIWVGRNNVPGAFEVVFRAQDPKKDDYRAAAEWMIQRASITH